MRYKVQEIITGEYEKQLIVSEDACGKTTQNSRSIRVHLQDGWIDTPAELGDLVHVLAHVQEAGGSDDELHHATCNSLSGTQTGSTKPQCSLMHCLVSPSSHLYFSISCPVAGVSPRPDNFGQF